MTAELGIVIPVLEANSKLYDFLQQLALVMIKNSINAEVAVISVDSAFHLEVDKYRTLHERYLLNLKCLTTKNPALQYGRAIRIGVSNLDCRFIVVVTPDGSCDMNLIPKLLNSCRNGSALTIANRFDLSNVKPAPALSRITQKLFRNVTSLLVGLRLPQDSTFVYRAFPKSYFDYFAISGNGWDMLAEQSIKTLLSGESIVNIPNQYFKSDSKVKFSYSRNSFGYIRIVMRGLLHRLGLPWF